MNTQSTIDLSRFQDSKHPLNNHSFYKLLVESQLLTQASGWVPLHFLNDDGHSLGYIKSHSYGEYIFDWAWADLYYKLGLSYYPKLIHAIPFTPVNSLKLLGSNKEKLAKNIYEYYLNNQELSSHHYLFTNNEESRILDSMGYFKQKSIQYHWKIRGKSFLDFLDSLKGRKRKQIKKERQKVGDYNLKILSKPISLITETEIKTIFNLYLSTIDKKQSHAYLNQDFFNLLISHYSDSIFFNLAYKNYNVAKYIPFGPVKDVMPYLIRRAEENTSVAGQTGRELALLTKEKKRRKNA